MDYDIVKTYLDKQKIKVVEEYDFEKKKVQYTDKIKGWKIKKYKPEEVVRSFILTKLVNELGYKPERIEIETEYDFGHPKVNKPRIDIIVRNENDDNVFMFIELKTPEEYETNKDEIIEKQLYNLSGGEITKGRTVKYLVLYTFDIDEKIKDKCLLIDFNKYNSFDFWKNERNYADEIPARYERAIKEPYVKGGKKDLVKNFVGEQLVSLRANLHDVLWGGGGTDDNDVFS